jgi:hypothetical protein
MIGVGCRGKDIFVAITAANVEREPLGLGNVWPKTVIPSVTDTAVKDISNTPYNNSSDYFYDLYDGENVGRSGHYPYVRVFDYSKLAGAGIPAKAGSGKLEAKNNMWIIAANITEADDPRIPVLISRNVDVKEFERIVNKGLKKSEFRKRVKFNKMFDEPFQEEGYVMICKDGRILFSRGWFKMNIGELFDRKELPPRDPSKPPIVYLMP